MQVTPSGAPNFAHQLQISASPIKPLVLAFLLEEGVELIKIYLDCRNAE